MTVFPVTAESNTDSKAALEYKIYLYDSGDLQITGHTRAWTLTVLFRGAGCDSRCQPTVARERSKTSWSTTRRRTGSRL